MAQLEITAGRELEYSIGFAGLKPAFSFVSFLVSLAVPSELPLPRCDQPFAPEQFPCETCTLVPRPWATKLPFGASNYLNRGRSYSSKETGGNAGTYFRDDGKQ
jgi:hypothetical protein